MLILAIETSCDDTGIAILNDRKVIFNSTISQIKTFKKYGGVIPELSSRLHADNINKLINIAINNSGISFEDLNYIAFTQGPGLINTLQVGLVVAKTLSQKLNIPLVPINHLEGHLFSPFIEMEVSDDLLNEKKLGVLVSGGHTQLIEMDGNFNYKLVSTTRDDTIGEVFDKVGTMIGVGYPGGPAIDKLSKSGNDIYNFKVSKLENYEFSYSGLKSQVRRVTDKQSFKKEDVALAFQNSATEQLIHQLKKYLSNNKDIKKIIMAGGVSANSMLRDKIDELGNYEVYVPKLKYCQDNAAMIGNIANLRINKTNNFTSDLDIDSYPRVK